MEKSKQSLIKISTDQIDLLINLSRATFLESFSAQNSNETIEQYLDDNFNHQELTRQLENPFSEFYLLLQNNDAIGYLKLNSKSAQTESTDDNALEIERIYVLAEYHGMKLGKRLLEKAIEIYQQNQYSFLWLGVWEENKSAIEFYRKFGFEKFGEHKFNFGGDIQTDWLMKKIHKKASKNTGS